MALGKPHPSQGQLVPERVYYGIGRPIPMRMATPPGEDGVVVDVELLRPVSGEVFARAAVSAGFVDLAAAFPQLWGQESGGGRVSPGVLYAQAVVNGRKLGAPVVLQPMLTPRYAPRVDRAGLPIWAGGPEDVRVYSGIRAYVDRHVLLETDRGEIEIALRPDAAPNTVWHVRGLVEGGFYTDIAIHRIASLSKQALNDIVQFGDPTGTGSGGPGVAIDLEDSSLRQGYGVVSLARSVGGDANSGGSQIFIGLSRVGTAALDGRYAGFGMVVRGVETLERLAKTPVDAEGRPVESVRIRNARLVDAPAYPEGSRPAGPPAPAQNRPAR